MRRIKERYAPYEELVNAITHGAGLLLSLIGLVVLIGFSARYGDMWQMVSVTVFGISLVLLYAASTMYHSVNSPRAKHYLRIFDHVAIYILIAGSYTPFTLITLKGPLGYTLFGIIWALAITGILLKIFHKKRFTKWLTLPYLGMGWLVVIAFKPVIEALPLEGLLWLIAGGLLYTAGFIFYAWRSLPFNHGIWHLFVMGGSACHFIAVLGYVVMQG